jgi:hypothetical protein
VRFHLIVVLIAFAGALPAFAQESPEATKPLVHQHNAGDATSDLFPSREGSGTTWLPDDTPMNGVEFSWRGWRLMGARRRVRPVPLRAVHLTGGFNTRQRERSAGLDA